MSCQWLAISGSKRDFLRGSSSSSRSERGSSTGYCIGRQKQTAALVRLRWSRRQHRKRSEKQAGQTQKAIAHYHNTYGNARTPDYLMATAGCSGPGISRRPGPGRWKTWAHEKLCKVAFAPRTSLRGAARSEGSPTSITEAKHVVASVLADATANILKRSREASQEQPFRYQIINTMRDETKLWVQQDSVNGRGQRRTKKRRILSSHSQVRWCTAAGLVETVDVCRQPRMLQSYTAASVATCVAHPTDPAGLCPSADVRPLALWRGSLMSSDSHAVNKLLWKFVQSQDDDLHHLVVAVVV